jgi:hypothetical protein
MVNEFISEQTFLNAAEVAPFARLLMCFERLVLLFESVCQFSHLLRKDVGPRLKLRIKEHIVNSIK